MEFFILLVLSIGLCQASPLRGELSSGDPEVIAVAARAIKALNEDRGHGNKLALGTILHACRTPGTGKSFLIVYQVRETMCPVGVDKPWQKCELLRTSKGHSGNCKADIDLDESQKFTYISQTCKISRGQKNGGQSHGYCAGCWYRIKNPDPKVLRIVRHTIEQFNDQSQQSSLFDLAVLKVAESQVINGVNYRFQYFIKETNCSKNEFADLSPECKLRSGGLKGSCKAKAYIDNGGKFVHSQVKCRMEAKDNTRTLAQVCTGCHSPIGVDSQELKEPLEAVVKLFNMKSSSDFYYRIVEITNISGQMFIGHVYRIDFKAQRTNCSKAEVQKPDDTCTTVKDGERMTCYALIYVKPWEPSVVPQVKCIDDQPFQATELEESQHSEDQVTFSQDYDTVY